MKPKENLKNDLKKMSVIAFPMKSIYGGPPSVILGLAESLAKEYSLSYVLLGEHDSEYQALAKYGNLLVQRAFNFNIQRLFFRFNRNVKEHLKNSEIILIHGYYFLSTLYVLLNPRIKAKVFCMPHGVFELYQQKQGRNKKRIFDLLVKHFSKNRVNGFLVASTLEIEGVNAKFPSASISVVGIGLDQKSFPRVGELSYPRLSSDISLLHMGRITRKKRIDLMLQALKVLIAEGCSAHLTITGSGDVEYEQELVDYVSRNELTNFVVFTGNVSGEKKDEIFKKSTLLLLPSENENFAVSVAEATAYGIPVVISRNIGMKEHVEKYNTGIICQGLGVSEIVSGIHSALANYDQLSRNALESREFLTYQALIKNWKRALSGERI
jgi:glycosyltransferase involved in cell wall biosynthesis